MYRVSQHSLLKRSQSVFSLNMRDQVLLVPKTAGKIILYILCFSYKLITTVPDKKDVIAYRYLKKNIHVLFIIS
jgi:hypothetical protein